MAMIGRNVECPCGSARKYKHCCLNRVDWERLLAKPQATQARYLTTRGKNLRFMAVIAQALQLESIQQPAKFADFKNTFTPDVVREIYGSLAKACPKFDKQL